MSKVNEALTKLVQMTCGSSSMRYKNVQDEEICRCEKVAFDSRFQSPPIVPCCDPCPDCGRNIKKYWYTSHAARCLQEKLKSEETTRNHVCTCLCHSLGGDILMHKNNEPCCEMCPYCLNNIVRDKFEAHAVGCIITHSTSLSAIIDQKESKR